MRKSLSNETMRRGFRPKVLGAITFVLVFMYAVSLIPQPAHSLTGVGQEQICAINDASAGANFGTDSNDSEGQTFDPPSSFALGAVKLNIYKFPTAATGNINIHIATNSPNASTGAPDYNNILATETMDISLLDEWDGVTPGNNQMVCDPDIDSAQVVIFDPSVPLSGSTFYSIIIDGPGTFPTDQIVTPFTGSDNFYTGGNHWECNVPTSCTRTTPGTWDLSGGVHDMGFAVFDDLVDFTAPETSAEAWLDRLLTDLQLNDTNGRLVAAMIVAVFIVFAMAAAHAHPAIILGLVSFWGGTAVSATLIPGWITLTLAALFMILFIYGFIIARQSDPSPGSM